MSNTVVIADASPLIALARINHLHLLPQLFSEVFMTETVRQEVVSGGNFADSKPVEQAIKAGWLQVKKLPESQYKTANQLLLDGLDPGEKSSILWALELQDNGQLTRLIIDDAKGRAAARRLSLELIGSAGIIATAKRLDLIPHARPLLEQLRASGYYLSQTVVDAALKIAGEKS
ncbi:DUF3368 domain-containing protein [Thiothrix nivea]|uniref:DUF3368 domain-containing protein n=1 Tax=Thiothrix nivea (strain ATCC 35100 / DSM 5205 / JP2) TaxID=870187 RepID=A0A656HEL5_THINJ|nr:DUF3368 domain-containing protein [Thiothrix nivea]EIJ34857.1 hypothetical protein Thini_2303 [Thiothrix nivea DSM 5205]